MKFFWFVILFLFFNIFTNVKAETWHLKSPVYRGPLPTFADLFVLKDVSPEQKEKLNALFTQKVLLPNISGWVDMEVLFSLNNEITPNENWKLWIDICEVIDESILKHSVISTLNKQLAAHNIRIDKINTVKPNEICVVDAINNVQVELKNSSVISSNLVVDLTFDSKQRIEISLNASLSTYSAFAKHDFRAGQKVELIENDFSWQPVSRVHIQSLLMPQNFSGKALRKIKKNQRFSFNNVQEKVAIEKGEQVVVIVEKAGLKIESKGKALNRGRIGENVIVLVNRSITPISGKVVKEGIVNVPVL